MGRLEGKVALITGAARGQGRSHAVRLAEEGADIVALDICRQVGSTPYEGATPQDLEQTVRLVEALGRRVISAEVDVRDYDQLSASISEAAAALGGLDVVVANAGIASYGAVGSALSETSWQEMIDVNLTGVWHTTKASEPHLRDSGSIVIISSTAGLRGTRGLAHYAAAKHGVVGLMRVLAHELGGRGIRVNTVHPTQVPTDMIMNEACYATFCPGLPNPGVDDFAAVSQSLMLLPTPWVEARDVSNAVLFLASDESRFVTALTMTVDAGLLAK